MFAVYLSIAYWSVALSAKETVKPEWLQDHNNSLFEVGEVPRRIVSLSVGSDEIIYDLLEKDGLDRVVAFSPYAKNKEYSIIFDKIGKIPAKGGEEIEGLIALKPDLIIAATYTRPELLKALNAAKLKTFVLGGFRSIDDITRNITTIGKLLRAEQRASEINAQFTQRLSKLQHAIHPPKVLTVLNYSDDNTIWGSHTLFDAAVHAAGVVNLAAQIGLKDWPQITMEVLVTLKPDYIIAPGEVADRDRIIKSIQQRPGWKELEAVKKGKIIVIPTRIMCSVSHHIIEFVEMINKNVYQ